MRPHLSHSILSGEPRTYSQPPLIHNSLLITRKSIASCAVWVSTRTIHPGQCIIGATSIALRLVCDKVCMDSRARDLVLVSVPRYAVSDHSQPPAASPPWTCLCPSTRVRSDLRVTLEIIQLLGHRVPCAAFMQSENTAGPRQQCGPCSLSILLFHRTHPD